MYNYDQSEGPFYNFLPILKWRLVERSFNNPRIFTWPDQVASLSPDFYTAGYYRVIEVLLHSDVYAVSSRVLFCESINFDLPLAPP